MSQARTYVPIGSSWRHKKGDEYFVVGHCVLAGYKVPAILCRGKDSIVWCRPATQFLDGRFTRLDQMSGSSISALPPLAASTDDSDSHPGE